MQSFVNLSLAALLAAGWIVWVVRILLRQRALTRAQSASADHLIIYASQTGQAFQHAKMQQQRSGGLLVAANKVSGQQLGNAQRIECFLSTYGEGEPPDNGHGLESTIRSMAGQINASFSVIAFGDSQYPDFCAFGFRIDSVLRAAGAKASSDVQTVDASHADARLPINQQANVRLLQRQCLNPQSEHPGLYLVTLEAPGQHWQAGDILDVYPPADSHDQAPRSYTIANIQASKLELVVRQLRKSDGSLGVMSGLLTCTWPLNESLQVSIRSNPVCQIGDHTAPLILIGAGSGLAGIRAQLQARATHTDAGPVWVIYGERDADTDTPLQHEFEAFCARGVIQRLDNVYSRETGATRYVQHVIAQHAEAFSQFVGDGGHVYVCGSLQGMGEDVDRILHTVLGEQRLAQLAHQDRYHRDLY